MRKIFIFLIVLLIGIVSIFTSLQVIGNNFQTYENYTYTLNNDDTVNLVKYDIDSDDSTVTIPYMIDGKVVSCVKSNAVNCSNVTEIIIEYVIERIESSAFFNCENVVYLSYPANQKGKNIFDGLTNLQILNINFGDNGIMLDYQSEKETPWYNTKDSISIISIDDGIRYLGNYSFANMANLSEVNLSDTIVSIGKYCFYNDTKISSLSLPNTIKSLGDYCLNFDTKDNISYSLVLPQSIAFLGENVFNNNLHYYVYKDSYVDKYLTENNINFNEIDLSLKEDISTVSLGHGLLLEVKDFPTGFYEEVTFTSDNPSIISIDESGYCTSNGTGIATITASTSSGYKSMEVEVIYNDDTREAKYILLNTNDSFTIDGSSYQNLNGSNRLQFESENPDIISVDDSGNVKGLKVGYGKIRISDENHNEVVYLVHVQTLIQKISTSYTSITLRKGGVYNIEATVYPTNATNKKLTYTSSDPEVVSVNASGRVIAYQNGSATITISSNDGSNTSTTISIQVTNSTIDVDTRTIAVMENKPFALRVSQEGVTYTSENPAIATVDSNGVITGVKAGSTTIEISNQSKTAFAAVNVTVYAGYSYGIDISRWNGNYLTVDNFLQAKSDGIDFVYLRAGIGSNEKDINFEKNYASVKASGLDVGAYHFILATNVTEAKEEAAAMLGWLKGKQFEYPIMVDIESKSQKYIDAVSWNAIVDTYCSLLEQNGYYVIVYSYASMLNRTNGKHDCWVAQWNVASPYTFKKKYTIWQFTAYGKVSGFAGYVDMDICFYNYPEFIKSNHYNGY